MKSAFIRVAAVAAWLAGPGCLSGCSPDLYEESPYRTYVCDVAPASGGGFLVLTYERKEAVYRGTCIDRVMCSFEYAVFGLARFDENGAQQWRTTIREDDPKIDGHEVTCGRVDDIDGQIVVTGWLSLNREGNRLWIVGLDEDGERLWGRVEEDSNPGYRSPFGYPSDAPWKTLVTRSRDDLVTVSGLAMEGMIVRGLYTLDLDEEGEIRNRRLIGIEGWPWYVDVFVQDLDPVRDGGHALLVSFWDTDGNYEGCAAARIDDAGDINWIRSFDRSEDIHGKPARIRQADDGSFLITLTQSHSTTLVGLDGEGEVVEATAWPQTNASLETTPDGFVLLAGWKSGGPSETYSKLSFIKASRSGESAWERTFDLFHGPHPFCPTTLQLTPFPGGGAVLVMGWATIVGVGPDGETLWSIDRSFGCD
jgi:hypothetical protein